MPTRHWLGAGSKSVDRMTTALRWLSDATMPGEKALMVVHTRHNAAEYSDIGDVLGAPAAKALQRAKQFASGRALCRS
jgi:hypothetical protein